MQAEHGVPTVGIKMHERPRLMPPSPLVALGMRAAPHWRGEKGPERFERPDAALLCEKYFITKPNVAKHDLDVVRGRKPVVPDGRREEALYMHDVLFDGRDPHRRLAAGLSPDALDGLRVVLASLALTGSDFLQCAHPAEQTPPLERVQGTVAEHFRKQPGVALYVSAMVL